MSENAAGLLRTLKGDPELQAKFKEAGEGGFEALSKEQGHPCTVEEFQGALMTAAQDVVVADPDAAKGPQPQAVVVVSIAVV